MNKLPSPPEIKQIEISSLWKGFADPSSVSAKLSIIRDGQRFVRQLALATTSDELPEPVIGRLLGVLARPAIPSLDPKLFELPTVAIERHYDSHWTGDHPSILIQIVFQDKRQITIRSNVQQAFMLPLKITDSATNVPYDTFDPALSRAIAELMPEGHLDRDRLTGRLGMLDLDLEETAYNDREAASRMNQTKTD